ncbi:hypothetical protein [Streptomyces sp. NPDC051992]|uniref:hypothetical protein n=1 Tax=Streptomyces sp. NPDC051992 TaxID=3161012 RepID=UPI00342EFE04
MRIVFVHGTGVRRERFDQLAALVTSGLTARLPDAELVPIYWGDAYGAKLGAGGASIPGFNGVRGTGNPSPLDQETAEWSLLLTDPLCELRVLAELTAEDDDGLRMPGVRAAGEEIADRLAMLQGAPLPSELNLMLHSTGIAFSYPAAFETVTGSVEFAGACETSFDAPAARELAATVARSVVAQALNAAGDAALCTGDERDRLASPFRLG